MSNKQKEAYRIPGIPHSASGSRSHHTVPYIFPVKVSEKFPAGLGEGMDGGFDFGAGMWWKFLPPVSKRPLLQQCTFPYSCSSDLRFLHSV